MTESTKARRDMFRRHCSECDRISTKLRALLDAGVAYRQTGYPAYPEELRGLQCGAKTRAGTPCKLTSLYTSGRCKFHGGLSTGPTTPEGKAKSSENGRKGGRPKTKPVETHEKLSSMATREPTGGAAS